MKKKNLSFKVSTTFKNTTIKSTSTLNFIIFFFFFFCSRNKGQTIFIHVDPCFFFLVSTHDVKYVNNKHQNKTHFKILCKI